MRKSKCTRSGHRQQRRVLSVLSAFPLSFGKFCGKPLSCVPASYLRWMLTAESIPDADRWAAGQFLEAVGSSRRRRPGRRQETTTPAAGTVGAGK
jgi:uncharacterized protein (DUF3820 family)